MNPKMLESYYGTPKMVPLIFGNPMCETKVFNEGAKDDVSCP